jgi:hypothetical protein
MLRGDDIRELLSAAEQDHQHTRAGHTNAIQVEGTSFQFVIEYGDPWAYAAFSSSSSSSCSIQSINLFYLLG